MVVVSPTYITDVRDLPGVLAEAPGHVGVGGARGHRGVGAARPLVLPRHQSRAQQAGRCQYQQRHAA